MTQCSVPWHGVYEELPIAGIEPSGWMRAILENLRDGLTGHLEAAGYPFGVVDWHGGQEHNRCAFVWEPYEQTAYWIDGIYRCGMLLRDSSLLERANERFDHLLQHVDRDGYIGPSALKEYPESVAQDTSGLRHYKRRFRWPHAILFRGWLANHDTHVAEAIARHYQHDAYDYTQDRDVLNMEAAIMAGRIGNSDELCNLAISWYQSFSESAADKPFSLRSLQSDDPPSGHGVTYCEMGKLPALGYLITGNEEWLSASVNAWRKLDQHQMLVDGIPSSSEHLRGKDPLDSHETCDIADYCWSTGYLLIATGSVEYADKIERAVFNAGFGAITNDAKALQYFSCPNQVICNHQSNHNTTFRGRKHMSYRPNPGTPCCAGNVNRIFPHYASRQWMKRGEDGIAALLYAPSSVTTRIGATTVRIDEKTDYPFDERITFAVTADQPVEFRLWLRVPGWCALPALTINGDQGPTPVTGEMVEIRRVWRTGDVITLDLPMQLAVSRWGEVGQAIERGPLVYSLKIDERWEIDAEEQGQSASMPAWDLYPESPWNYALRGRTTDQRLDSITVVKEKITQDPWSDPPISLKVPAYRIAEWTLNEEAVVSRDVGDSSLDGSIADGESERFSMTPPLPSRAALAHMSKEPADITLVPYGTTQLRVTIFPVVDT